MEQVVNSSTANQITLSGGQAQGGYNATVATLNSSFEVLQGPDSSVPFGIQPAVTTEAGKIYVKVVQGGPACPPTCSTVLAGVTVHLQSGRNGNKDVTTDVNGVATFPGLLPDNVSLNTDHDVTSGGNPYLGLPFPMPSVVPVPTNAPGSTNANPLFLVLGSASGGATRQKVCAREAPRLDAASSGSSPIARKALRKGCTAKGSE